MVHRRRRRIKIEAKVAQGRAAVIVRSVSAVLAATGNAVRAVTESEVRAVIVAVVEAVQGRVIASAAEAVTGIAREVDLVTEDVPDLALGIVGVLRGIVVVVLVPALVLLTIVIDVRRSGGHRHREIGYLARNVAMLCLSLRGRHHHVVPNWI